VTAGRLRVTSRGSPCGARVAPLLRSGNMLATNCNENGGPPLDVAPIIRTWRRRVGLTQEGLAQALSLSFSTVSRWENGRVKPSRLAWRALERLAAERGTPLLNGSAADGG